MRTPIAMTGLGALGMSACVFAWGCIFPDMPTSTPNGLSGPPAETAPDGGVTIEEYIAQVERLQEAQRKYERLEAKSERLKDELAALEQEARARRARHIEKFGLWENFAMLVVAVGLAAVVSRWVPAKRRSRKEDGSSGESG